MRSCLSLLLCLVLLVLALGTCGLVWYLSKTAEFSRVAESAVIPAPEAATGDPD